VFAIRYKRKGKKSIVILLTGTAILLAVIGVHRMVYTSGADCSLIGYGNGYKVKRFSSIVKDCFPCEVSRGGRELFTYKIYCPFD